MHAKKIKVAAFVESLLSACDLRDPQKVCAECDSVLRPYQVQLTHTIANHQCTNTIDVEGHCSPRYFNLPYAYDLAGEIRKAAYATYNLFNTEWISDKAIPGQLLKSARGLAFLTVLTIFSTNGLSISSNKNDPKCP